MIHLKYKCKVNFVKLPLIWIYLCLQLVFENATAGRNTGCRSVVNCARCAAASCSARRIPTHPTLPRIPPKCRDNGNCTVCSWLKSANKLAECMTLPAGSVRRFTRGRVWELKNGHNSVTDQNRTHVYMNFFRHKDLGNHLLHLCPKVVKHPVYSQFMMHGQKNINCCDTVYSLHLD